MLIIDESFDGGWDLLGSQIETHLIDKLIESLSRHVGLLGLIFVGIVKSLIDSFLELRLLLNAF